MNARWWTRLEPGECFGGPLDGQTAPLTVLKKGFVGAFPWPRGWYYFAPGWGGYIWRDQPGTYTPEDEQLLRSWGAIPDT